MGAGGGGGGKPVLGGTNERQSICDEALYNFAPSFGPFAIDQCGDKVVSTLARGGGVCWD